MIAVFAIMFFTIYLTFLFPVETRAKKVEEKSPKYSAQMKKLWSIAQTAMKDRKPFRAEKALLTILKFDEKNAAAYNRLGILYAKGQRYDEAVECFEIAQSLDNNPASIHNAGLIYFETGAYEKAELAFQQAISLEGDVPARYIALARTEEKLGRPKKAVDALENAYELDPKISTLKQILTIYENTNDVEAATATMARIEAQVAREDEIKRRRATSRALKAMRASAANVRVASRMASRSKVSSKSTRTATAAKSSARKSTQRVSAARVIKPHAGRKRV